jgi:hypothetical protein
MSRETTMNEATDFEDKESIGHPRSQVYATFRDAETARRAAKELNQIGIEPAGIGLLVGNKDAAKLDAATGEHGFLAQVERMGLQMGDTDTDYLAYYRRALLEGYAVITVVTHDDASRTKVRTLLKTYGAHAMTYFGQFSTEIWEG